MLLCNAKLPFFHYFLLLSNSKTLNFLCWLGVSLSINSSLEVKVRGTFFGKHITKPEGIAVLFQIPVCTT